MLSTSFVRRVIGKLEQMDRGALQSFIRQLGEERDFFHFIFDSMTEGVLITDEEHRVLFANNTAGVLLNMERSKLRHEPVFHCIKSADLHNMLTNALVHHERIRNREVGLYYPSDRILNLNVFPLLRDGVSYGNVIIFMDITREKKEQQQLRRAESMAALSAITAGIAHEIKNPLGAIDLHLQLMERRIRKDERHSGGRLQGYLQIVQQEVRRLNTIVVDFLAAIRPMKVNPSRISPNRIVEDLAEFIQIGLEAQGTELVLDLDDHMPGVLLDYRLTRQALLNLINNGKEALESGGCVRVSTRVDGDFAVVEVADNGPGIEKEKLNSIFEPYYTSKNYGTGLGLTIVYRIVQEQGGQIAVNSEPGEGTVFQIRFPLHRKKAHLLASDQDGDSSENLQQGS